MISKNKNIATYTVLIAVFVVFVILSFLSEGGFYGGDSYNHYFLSRYAFKYPVFFLDNWAKPLFTVLSSLFAQFGFHGMMIFNIIAGILACFFAIKTALELKYMNSVLLVFFICFAPVFTMLLFSGMTEIVFALLLISSVYYFIKEKYIISAIIISFIPFIRAEGLVFIPWFMILLVIKKQYKAIPFLISGILFYTILGGLILKDFLWLINNNPYKTSNNIYGHGDLLFYVKSIDRTFGILSTFLAIGGIFSLVFLFVKKIKSNSFFNQMFVIAFPALGYFLMHTILWWKGWMSVLGDDRFMAGIVPLIAILALKGFNSLSFYFKDKKIIIYPIILIITFFIIKSSLNMYKLPIKIDGEDKVSKQAALWVKNSQYFGNKIIYYSPIIPFILDVNPYDRKLIQERVNNPSVPEENISKGSIVIWDSHFGPNEGNLPLSKLKDNSSFSLLKTFIPETPFKTLNGYDFEVSVFVRN